MAVGMIDDCNSNKSGKKERERPTGLSFLEEWWEEERVVENGRRLRGDRSLCSKIIIIVPGGHVLLRFSSTFFTTTLWFSVVPQNEISRTLVELGLNGGSTTGRSQLCFSHVKIVTIASDYYQPMIGPWWSHYGELYSVYQTHWLPDHGPGRIGVRTRLMEYEHTSRWGMMPMKDTLNLNFGDPLVKTTAKVQDAHER